MHELQVETFGSMDRREKVDFILEQMRLSKAKGDWDRVAITGKKVNMKWIAEKENEVCLFQRVHPNGIWVINEDNNRT
jgi:26S proteasome regulatory subunit N5